MTDSPEELMRLQKYLARCGVGSRRACEEVIRSGRVAVDGVVITQMGTMVDPSAHQVTVDGKPVQAESFCYWLLHKPPGVVCTSKDPQGRSKAIDLIPGMSGRVYTVGRLDRDSEGLIVLTNDGDLAFRMTHPRHHVVKTYEVAITRKLSGRDIQQFLRGIEDGGERLVAKRVEPMSSARERYQYRIVLGEGKNRQIRRMVDAVGARVKRLVRVEFGPLQLGRLKPGQFRKLTETERWALDQLVRPDC